MILVALLDSCSSKCAAAWTPRRACCSRPAFGTCATTPGCLVFVNRHRFADILAITLLCASCLATCTQAPPNLSHVCAAALLACCLYVCRVLCGSSLMYCVTAAQHAHQHASGGCAQNISRCAGTVTTGSAGRATCVITWIACRLGWHGYSSCGTSHTQASRTVVVNTNSSSIHALLNGCLAGINSGLTVVQSFWSSIAVQCCIGCDVAVLVHVKLTHTT